MNCDSDCQEARRAATSPTVTKNSGACSPHPPPQAASPALEATRDQELRTSLTKARNCGNFYDQIHLIILKCFSTTAYIHDWIGKKLIVLVKIGFDWQWPSNPPTVISSWFKSCQILIGAHTYTYTSPFSNFPFPPQTSKRLTGKKRNTEITNVK